MIVPNEFKLRYEKCEELLIDKLHMDKYIGLQPSKLKKTVEQDVKKIIKEEFLNKFELIQNIIKDNSICIFCGNEIGINHHEVCPGPTD